MRNKELINQYIENIQPLSKTNKSFIKIFILELIFSFQFSRKYDLQIKSLNIKSPFKYRRTYKVLRKNRDLYSKITKIQIRHALTTNYYFITRAIIAASIIFTIWLHNLVINGSDGNLLVNFVFPCIFCYFLVILLLSLFKYIMYYSKNGIDENDFNSYIDELKKL